MTILLGDTGKVAYGPIKTFNFNYATPYENLQTTPLSVPNVSSIPGTPIFSYTLQSSDIPTISPSCLSTSYSLLVYVGGKNTDTASKTVNIQINRNGSLLLSGTATPSSAQYYTLSNYGLVNNLQAGDKIDVYLWCSTSSLINFDYFGLSANFTQTFLSKAKILINLTYTMNNPPNLTQGNPSIGTTGTYYLYLNTANNNQWGINSTCTLPVGYIGGQYGLGREQYGDYINGSVFNYSDATYRPKYVRNIVPTQISFREVLR